jgi:GNAT superfamily N-acetyltransferase
VRTRRAIRPYRGGKRRTPVYDFSNDVKPHSEHPVPPPGTPGGPGREHRVLDLAFDASQPRDEAGRWVDTLHFESYGKPTYTGGVKAHTPDGKFVGEIKWWSGDETPVVDNLYVAEQFRRRGAGRALFQRARTLVPGLRHSRQLSPDGKAFAAAVDLAFDPHQPRDPHTGQWIASPSNVVSMWNQTTPGEREAGASWYPMAHQTALALAKKYGVSKEEAAGLLAAYSPQTPWGRDQIEASEALRYGHGVGGKAGAVWFTHDDPTVEDRVGIMATGGTRALADKIIAGGDFDTLTAGRNKDGTLKPNSPKIRAFYHLIAAGGQPDPANPRVVIDRHAMSVVYGKRLTNEDYTRMRPGSTKKYQPLVDAYVEAAKEISKQEGHTVSPETVQAATWLAQQRQNAAMQNRVGRTRKALGNMDWAEWTKYAARYLGLDTAKGAKVGYSDLAKVMRDEIIDLANPSIDRTRRITHQLVAGKSVVSLLTRRGISRDVADAINAMVDKGTVTRPNARRRGHELTFAIRLERDREALYRGAYVLKASERVQEAVDNGRSLQEALQREQGYFKMHEQARKHRLDMVTMTQRIGQRFGEIVQDPNGAQRTLVGWYHNPLINNDEECLAASGHNFYAEEGTILGFPGAVHLGCGCYAGPPIEGAGMVNDAVSGVVSIEHVVPKPAYTLKSRKRKTA